MPTPTIVLFGLRGSGKTTLGRLLATRLNRPFVDLDDRVRARLGGATIAEAFRGAGELAFREAECAELAALLEAERPSPRAARTTAAMVIALGGGTPTHLPSRRLLEDARARGTVHLILLEAAPAVLGARVAAAPGDRPLLAGSSFAEEALLLTERRMPIYRALAATAIRTDQPTDTALTLLVNAAQK